MDRKEMIRDYKNTPRPAGVFRVRNTATGCSLVCASNDVSGQVNRFRFQLKNGSHPERGLQTDWKAHGEEAFEFETLDLLEPSEDPVRDVTDELQALKDLWLEKLAEGGEELYPGSRRKA